MLLLLLACKKESNVPEDATRYSVTVTAIEDECHPDSTEGFEETFEYAIVLDGSTARIFIGEQQFAVGLASGCTLTYQTAIIGEETEADGNIKWQLFGESELDAGDNACVPSENDWEGTEYFEVLSSDEDSLDVGCEYKMETKGKLVAD
jgi:hypothetical protein